MTDDATRAQRLLAPLRERPHSVDSARAEVRRARVVPRLRRHLASVALKRQNSRRVRYLLVGLAAVLGAGVCGAAFERFGVPQPALAHRAGEIRAVQGHLVHRVSGAEHTVLAGDRLVVPVAGELRTDQTSGASLETEAGLRLDLDANSRMSLSEMADQGPERRVELRGGQLACAVPKLTPGSTFSVVTPNARVVVHGTKFTVRVDSSEAGVTRTCVRVREGLVAVHHATGRAMLHAGEAWGCPGEEPVARNEIPANALPKVPANARRAAPINSTLGSPRKGTPPRPSREGTLARETELLQSALAAERGGRREVATAALTQLLATYPESPLSPEAREALKRVAVPPSQGP
jgi:hypothetical protein